MRAQLPPPRPGGRIFVHSLLDGSSSGPSPVAELIGDSQRHLLCLQPPPALLTCPAVHTARSRHASASRPHQLSAHAAEAELRKGREPHREPQEGLGRRPVLQDSQKVRGPREEECGRRPADQDSPAPGSGPWTAGPALRRGSRESGRQVALSHPRPGAPGSEAHSDQADSWRPTHPPSHPATRRGADLREPDGTRGAGDSAAWVRPA